MPPSIRRDLDRAIDALHRKNVMSARVAAAVAGIAARGAAAASAVAGREALRHAIAAGRPVRR